MSRKVLSLNWKVMRCVSTAAKQKFLNRLVIIRMWNPFSFSLPHVFNCTAVSWSWCVLCVLFRFYGYSCFTWKISLGPVVLQKGKMSSCHFVPFFNFTIILKSFIPSQKRDITGVTVCLLRVLDRFDTLPGHLTEDLQLFSLNDLTAVRNGDMAPRMKELLKLGTVHVASCVVRY